jgi:hypothetical protein
VNDIPVVLITYNRPWHTVQVIKALQRQGIQNLFIFSDAPKSGRDHKKVLETREIIKRIRWTKPEVICQTVNIGLAKSIVNATNYVFEKYDRLILLEDDCIPQDYFFDFMEECLRRYEQKEKIFGISGYTVPIPDRCLDSYPYDNYFSPRIGSWGWATWKRAWDLRENDLGKLVAMLAEREIDVNQGGNDIPAMIDLMKRGKLTDVWTLCWVLTVYLHGGCYVYPTRAHIINIGMDGSGVHCGKTNRFVTPPASRRPANYASTISFDANIMENFRSFYDSGATDTNASIDRMFGHVSKTVTRRIKYFVGNIVAGKSGRSE